MPGHELGAPLSGTNSVSGTNLKGRNINPIDTSSTSMQSLPVIPLPPTKPSAKTSHSRIPSHLICTILRDTYESDAYEKFSRLTTI